MEAAGKNLQGGDAETRRAAAAALGSARTPAKKAAAVLRAEARKGIPLAPETRQKLSEAGKERWAAIREKKAAAAALLPPVEKRPPGRPRKEPAPSLETTPKRGRGRPRKETPQTTVPEG